MGKLVYAKAVLGTTEPIGLQPEDSMYSSAKKMLEDERPGVIVEPSGYFALVLTDDLLYAIREAVPGDVIPFDSIEFVLQGVVKE